MTDEERLEFLDDMSLVLEVLHTQIDVQRRRHPVNSRERRRLNSVKNDLLNEAVNLQQDIAVIENRLARLDGPTQAQIEELNRLRDLVRQQTRSARTVEAGLKLATDVLALVEQLRS